MANPLDSSVTPSDAQAGDVDVTDGGIVARYPPGQKRRLRIAPTVDDVINTVVLEQWPTPTACVRLDYARFAFDSSFPHPSLSTELSRLFALRPPSGGDMLAVFGHADPIGDEGYNKTLAGRRAKAMYALLTHQPALWDELHQGSFHGDRWGAESLQACLATLGYEAGAINGKTSPQFRAAVRAFKRDQGLPVDEVTDHATRLALFGRYMDVLTKDSDGSPQAYAVADFVGDPGDASRRGAMQGCGFRNPAMVMSSEEQRALEPQSRREDLIKAHRVNRRVLIFLFRPEDVASMKLWPCPPASAGPQSCASVAWSDKDGRLKPSEKRREVRRAGKTFGCKFYDWVARLSPCEAVRGRVQIWLLDEKHQRMPNAPYRLKIASLTRVGAATDDGLLVEEEVPLGPAAYVEWGSNGTPPVEDASSTPTRAAMLSFAIDGSDGAPPGDAPNEPAPDSPLGALVRGLRDGQFPLYAGLLPERKSPFRARKKVALSAETAEAKSSEQETQQNDSRLRNLSLQPADASDVSAADQPFQKTYGDASLKDIHTNGVPAGGAPPPGPAIAADATIAPPSCAPLETPIRTILAGAPNRAPTHFQNNFAYEKTVGRNDSDAAPAPEFYQANLFNFQFLGQWFIPVAEKAPDGKAVDTSAKRTLTTDALVDTRQGVSKNFGTALEKVTCKLFGFFLEDPTVKDPSPKAFLEWVMVHQGLSGARGGIGDLHGSGSAVDINASTNPWLPVRRPDKRGGELHTSGLQAPGKKVTPVGQKILDAYSSTNLGTALIRFNDENIWTPCCDAIDAASKAYYGTPADLADRKPGEDSRACFTRFALASSAVVRFLRLAYGDRGDLTKPMSLQTAAGASQTYTLLDESRLFRFAVSDVVRGYVTPGSGLATLLASVGAASDAERGDEAKLQAKISESVTKLTEQERAGLRQMQSKAVDAHAVLRRGMVNGSVQFFGDRASAEKASAGINSTVFETTVTGVFGAVPAWRDPRVGFLNLRAELIDAFDQAGKELYGPPGAPGQPHFRWGAVDFDMGPGCSGDVMHFDFGVHDPGTPDDASLAAWRSLQQERILGRKAHKQVVANLAAAKASLGSGTKTLLQVDVTIAKVTLQDLHDRLSVVATRLPANSPGCAGRIADARAAIEQRSEQEFGTLFSDAVTSGPAAKPHRESLEAQVAPSQSVKANAASLDGVTKKLSKAALFAALQKRADGPAYENAKAQIDDVEKTCLKLEQAL